MLERADRCHGRAKSTGSFLTSTKVIDDFSSGAHCAVHWLNGATIPQSAVPSGFVGLRAAELRVRASYSLDDAAVRSIALSHAGATMVAVLGVIAADKPYFRTCNHDIERDTRI